MFLSTTLIIDSKIGQLGNSLLISAHVIACAIENNIKVVNIPFDDYAEFFVGTRNNLLCSYPTSCVHLPISKRMMFRGRTDFIIRKSIQHLTKYGLFSDYYTRYVESITIDWSDNFSLESYDFLTLIQNKKYIILKGWNFRSNLNVKKHASKIKKYFSPLAIYQQNVSVYLEEAKNNFDIIVGVHVRQGDYKKWHGGRFFYAMNIYQKIINKLRKYFSPNKTLFILCSDSPQPKNFFDSTDIIFGLGFLIEDMLLLSKCDYIIGPPSTFSLWASFYGETPLYHIYDPSCLPQVNDFKTQNDLFWEI